MVVGLETGSFSTIETWYRLLSIGYRVNPYMESAYMMISLAHLGVI